MDYIYKDKNEKKHIGEIGSLHIIPLYEFKIKTGKQKVKCYLDHQLSEWRINIPEYEANVELAYPTDTFWNSNAINEKIKDEDLSLQIAYAIKTVYLEI